MPQQMTDNRVCQFPYALRTFPTYAEDIGWTPMLPAPLAAG
jgi:hypothetical protein